MSSNKPKISTFFKWPLMLLIVWPERIAAHFLWAAPLVARVVVGYVFMLTGWTKLHNLPLMIENFTAWGIPFPEILTPLASGIECFGGLALMLGLCTRVSGGMLAVVMLVAIKAAKWGDIDSLETLFGFEETAYFVVFTWLAIAGAGKVSVDEWVLSSTTGRDQKILQKNP
ncbi:MAG: DoxX family protein [Burkholderiaceae bacterium]|jgi:putative oxidoreductase